jgi:transcriptional regulator with XRE-family HTH domain
MPRTPLKPSTEYPPFAELLVQFMYTRNPPMNITGLARLIDVSKATIINWLRESAYPQPQMLKLIEEKTGISEMELRIAIDKSKNLKFFQTFEELYRYAQEHIHTWNMPEEDEQLMLALLAQTVTENWKSTRSGWKRLCTYVLEEDISQFEKCLQISFLMQAYLADPVRDTDFSSLRHLAVRTPTQPE